MESTTNLGEGLIFPIVKCILKYLREGIASTQNISKFKSLLSEVRRLAESVNINSIKRRHIENTMSVVLRLMIPVMRNRARIKLY